MSVQGEFGALERDLAEVVAVMFAAGTMESTLQRLAELAVQAIDGCEAAGVMLAEGETITTLASSSELVVEIDQLQIDSGEGPCVDAATQGATIYVHDLHDDPRWPTFAPRAVDAGIRTVLAHPLSAARPSALNLYARLPVAFGATDRAQGSLFAALARTALESAHERASSEDKTKNLNDALVTRALIGQAQGILIERERITADQAFDVLRRASQALNVKLREVAATLVETGETPSDGRPSGGPG